MIQLTPGAIRIHCKHCGKETWHHYRPGFDGVHNSHWSRVKPRWVCKGERSAGLHHTIIIPESGCSRSPAEQSDRPMQKFMADWFRTAQGFDRWR